MGLQRYHVTAFDYDLWEVVVEALNSAQAVAKAKRIYCFNGFDAEDTCDHDVVWRAGPVHEEAV